MNNKLAAYQNRTRAQVSILSGVLSQFRRKPHEIDCIYLNHQAHVCSKNAVHFDFRHNLPWYKHSW